MQLIDIKELSGKITLLSGLHIGAGDMEMHIGGTDNAVIKHPHTQMPYIPGSSLKGKVRSLLEMRSGLTGISEGKPLGLKHLSMVEDQDQKTQCEKILKLFGTSGADTDESYQIGPTRISVADCSVSNEWQEKAREQNYVYTEVKAENTINRITGTAKDPRFTERVPAGVEFDFRITMKIFENDEDLMSLLLEGLKLLELDALGGSGSRGYGRVRINFDDPAVQEQFETVNI